MSAQDHHAFRSGLERRVARQITLSGHSFDYEADIISYLKPERKSKYTPDFILTKKDGAKMYIEAKGRFVTADRQKHLLIQKQHPEIDVRLLFQNASNKISKASNTTYAKWATSKGFKWADKGIIPQEWLDEC